MAVYTGDDNIRVCGKGGVLISGDEMAIGVLEVAAGLEKLGEAEVHVVTHHHRRHLWRGDKEQSLIQQYRQ